MAAVGLDDLKASLLLLMADCSITSLELRSPKACISPKLWDLAVDRKKKRIRPISQQQRSESHDLRCRWSAMAIIMHAY